MTTKTETLYRINMSPECIEIGLKHGTYEKVSHVLPDQIRDDAKKLELILKIGELIHDKIGLQKKIDELEKDERLKGHLFAHAETVRKNSIESQKREIDRLKAELSNLRPYHNLVVGFANQNHEGISRLIEEKNRLKSELEEAKKGEVRWEEDDFSSTTPVIYRGLGNLLNIRCDGYCCYIPLPPQPRTIDDEAKEAFATSVNNGFSSRSDKNGFIAGFKAAKEAQNG